jgi:hypothetical protein
MVQGYLSNCPGGMPALGNAILPKSRGHILGQSNVSIERHAAALDSRWLRTEGQAASPTSTTLRPDSPA